MLESGCCMHAGTVMLPPVCTERVIQEDSACDPWEVGEIGCKVEGTG